MKTHALNVKGQAFISNGHKNEKYWKRTFCEHDSQMKACIVLCQRESICVCQISFDIIQKRNLYMSCKVVKLRAYCVNLRGEMIECDGWTWWNSISSTLYCRFRLFIVWRTVFKNKNNNRKKLCIWVLGESMGLLDSTIICSCWNPPFYRPYESPKQWSFSHFVSQQATFSIF